MIRLIVPSLVAFAITILFFFVGRFQGYFYNPAEVTILYFVIVVLTKQILQEEGL